jgi:Tannase and feruloyl esterase
VVVLNKTSVTDNSASRKWIRIMSFNLHRRGLFAVSLAALLVPACGGGGGGANTSTSSATPMNCAGVSTASLAVSGLTVAAVSDEASFVAINPSQGHPAHCKVVGTLNARTGLDGNAYAIGVELRLPSNWNGRFFYAAEGGLAGSVQDPLGRKGWGGDTNALTQGFAVASSDSGHLGSSSDSSFGLDPQARLDYAHAALGTWAPLAKQAVQKYYGSAPSFSYFSGGSKGGHSGLMAASRYASHFEGILAGQPALDLHQAAVAAIHDSQQLATLDPGLSNAFTAQDLKLVAKRILNQCDLLDGAADQMVQDIVACNNIFDFAVDVAQCATGFVPDGTCLSPAQKIALGKIFAGSKTSSGSALYSDWLWDPGLIGSDWFTWKTATGPQLSASLLANVVDVPPSAPVLSLSAALNYLQSFDLDSAWAKLNASDANFTQSAVQMFSMPSPFALPALKAQGKLLIFHGTADPIFSANYTRAWYEKFLSADPTAASYIRLFLVPGMNHGGGGPSTDKFDAMTPLIQWVENGQSPHLISASVTPGNADLPSSWSASRSRPLCAYPSKAALISGATDFEAAASFDCQ